MRKCSSTILKNDRILAMLFREGGTLNNQELEGQIKREADLIKDPPFAV
jgi:hypothetical protein